MTELYVTAASRIGCVRSNNEDMILVGTSFVRNDDHKTRIALDDTKRTLIAVADGMGGHRSGDVASSDTLHNLQFFFSDIPSGLSACRLNEMIVEWLGSINAIIDSKGRVDEKYKGMGTTLVALAYYEGHFYSMNCGDSRLYRFCDGRLTQLTTDHTFKDVLDTGKRTSVITNCIGGGTRNSYVDMVQMTKDVQPGNIYLLCSDGLTDMLSDQEIETMLKAGADADMLCQAAIQAGGFDNVSVCTIEVKSKITT